MSRILPPRRHGRAEAAARGRVCPATRRSRPARLAALDEQALARQWPGDILGRLPAVRERAGRRSCPPRPGRRLATQLGAKRDLLITVLLSRSRCWTASCHLAGRAGWVAWKLDRAVLGRGGGVARGHRRAARGPGTLPGTSSCSPAGCPAAVPRAQRADAVAGLGWLVVVGPGDLKAAASRTGW